MMRIRAVDLPAQTALALEGLQADVSSFASYPDKVRRARDRYTVESRRGNETFDTVRRTLRSMCFGACRCMYCEDSMACEVEHFRPKALYPEFVFVWLNYLYSCGPCNRVKRSHFRIIIGDQANAVDLVWQPGQSPEPPQGGSIVLIDPRNEDPTDFIALDLVDTFLFIPRHPEGTRAYARASYTIELLRLNGRDDLPRARKEAYTAYCARLREYVAVRGTAAADRLSAVIPRCGHPTVWAEMKAQSALLPDLSKLFEAAPEALAWQ
jgi:hypothetical protein